MPIVLKVETRRLQCALGEEEVHGLSLELAQTFQDSQAEEDRQARDRAEMKAKLSKLHLRMQELSTNIVSKTIPRDVEVEVSLSGLSVIEVRRDTGEILFTRPAQPNELQTSLPGA